MAMAVLVTGRETGEPVIGPDAAERLAALGISRISVLRDSSGNGVVLEGWAFDPAGIDEAVRTMFPDADTRVRVFREVEHVAVARASNERRT